MLHPLRVVCAVIALLISAPASTAVMFPPTDHGGADLILASDVIWGVHTNIGTLTLLPGQTATVRPFNGSDVSRGMVEIHAQVIDIQGRLDATGAGFTGGGGGGGSGGVSTQGSGGSSAYSGFSGNPGTQDRGGRGSNGDGTAYGGGAPGGLSTTAAFTDADSGIDGSPGGYLSRSGDRNGDTSTDDSTFMGSGGGGGGGGGAQYGILVTDDGGGGGGGGGSGGGMIRLFASEQITLRGGGHLSTLGASNGAPGTSSTDSDGAPGGAGSGTSSNVFPNGGFGVNEGGRGGGGGAGGGGGILIDVSEASSVNFDPGFRISSGTGTLKIMHRGQDPSPLFFESTLVNVGREFSRNLSTDHPPQDHGGADLIIAEGDRIWGVHTNVGRFEIPDGVHAFVLRHDGSNAATGMVEIQADEIIIDGTLDAEGAGFTGGGGGGGGSGSTVGGGLGGGGNYPGFAGGDGNRSAGGPSGGEGRGGDGHAGDGTFAGGGGGGGVNGGQADGVTGVDGGYGAPGVNGDLSVDLSTLKGSGGGGGGGGRASGGHGGGGGAGGTGGGVIRLVPLNQLRLGPGAQLLSSGSPGGNGVSSADIFNFPEWASGGWAITRQQSLGGVGGGDGGNGGAGAGGGVLLDLRSGPTLDLHSGALVRSLGSRGETVNGGTVKIFHGESEPDLNGVAIEAGRLLIAEQGVQGFTLN